MESKPEIPSISNNDLFRGYGVYGVDSESSIHDTIPGTKRSGIMRKSLESSKRGSLKGPFGTLNKDEDTDRNASAENVRSSLPRKLIGSATIHINDDQITANSMRKKKHSLSIMNSERRGNSSALIFNEDVKVE